jgi:hypothetical protein
MGISLCHKVEMGYETYSLGTFPSVVERTECEADHSPPYSVEGENERSFTCIFWCLIKIFFHQSFRYFK